MQSIKEHNLKANHNRQRCILWWNTSVCNLSKNTIWKQITTNKGVATYQNILYAIYQRTQSESKSQQNRSSGLLKSVCMQSIKEHNLKANHNNLVTSCTVENSVCNLSKNTIWKQITTNISNLNSIRDLYAIYQRTQSESKSQLLPDPVLTQMSVCNLSKNTIWKQITTFLIRFNERDFLYAIYQRTQSESKSQPD